MPVFNLTIPDTSPLIVYDGTWTDSTHDFSGWSEYANGTFHSTQDYAASATLIFNGSAVYIFGSRQINHNYYITTLDGTVTTGYGQSNTPIYNSTLFNATNLGESQHHLVLTNTYTTSGAPYVDVDYMVITSGDGNAQTQSADVWLDDGAYNITYSDGWQTSLNGLEASYYMKTMHRTNVIGASATLLFNGNAITVYGATSTDHGLFSVSLDDSDSPLLLNGVAPAFRPQNILYYAGGLSNDSHNLTFMNADPSEAWFDLDKFVVSTWSANVSTSHTSNGITSGTADISKPTTSNTPNTNQSHTKETSLVVALVVLASIFVFVGVGSYWFMRRRHKRHLSLARPYPTPRRAMTLESEAASEPLDIDHVSEQAVSPTSVQAVASFRAPSPTDCVTPPLYDQKTLAIFHFLNSTRKSL